MKASYTKLGQNYLPVILHEEGTREILYGDPLVNAKTAKKYAMLEIYNRQLFSRRA